MVTSTHNFFCLKVAIGALVLFDSFLIFKITVFKTDNDCEDGALVLFDSFLIFEITLFRAEDDCRDVSSWPLDTNKGKVIWSPKRTSSSLCIFILYMNLK